MNHGTRQCGARSVRAEATRFSALQPDTVRHGAAQRHVTAAVQRVRSAVRCNATQRYMAVRCGAVICAAVQCTNHLSSRKTSTHIDRIRLLWMGISMSIDRSGSLHTDDHATHPNCRWERSSHRSDNFNRKLTVATLPRRHLSVAKFDLADTRVGTSHTAQLTQDSHHVHLMLRTKGYAACRYHHSYMHGRWVFCTSALILGPNGHKPNKCRLEMCVHHPSIPRSLLCKLVILTPRNSVQLRLRCCLLEVGHRHVLDLAASHRVDHLYLSWHT